MKIIKDETKNVKIKIGPHWFETESTKCLDCGNISDCLALDVTESFYICGKCYEKLGYMISPKVTMRAGKYPTGWRDMTQFKNRKDGVNGNPSNK